MVTMAQLLLRLAAVAAFEGLKLDGSGTLARHLVPVGIRLVRDHVLSYICAHELLQRVHRLPCGDLELVARLVSLA